MESKVFIGVSFKVKDMITIIESEMVTKEYVISLF